MKLTVSSSELLKAILTVQKAIPAKTTEAILENYLFDLKGSELSITASDNELTLKTVVKVETTGEEGSIAILGGYAGSGMNALSARIAGKGKPFTLSPLIAGHSHFFCVDDNDIIAAVNIWGKARLILSTKDLSDLCAKTTHNLVSSVYHNPLFLRSCLIHRNGLVR